MLMVIQVNIKQSNAASACLSKHRRGPITRTLDSGGGRITGIGDAKGNIIYTLSFMSRKATVTEI